MRIVKASPDLSPPPFARKSASQQIVSLVLDRIHSGEYQPGQRLPPEAMLLEKWKISPASLRDAFKELETLGLLSRRPRRGTIIQQFDPSRLFEQCAALVRHRKDLFQDLAELRQVMEDAFIPLVCRNGRASDWAAMETAIRRMSEAADMTEVVKQDLEFHRAFYRAAGNVFIRAMIPLLVEYFSGEVSTNQKKFPEQRRCQVREHSNFLQALKAGDVARARRHCRVLA
jgi:GntR family transcriptional repressor for pyruvate dehydrogenase complex